MRRQILQSNLTYKGEFQREDAFYILTHENRCIPR